MIFETKTMIPEVYSKERSIQIFNKLIDILATDIKNDIDKIIDLYDAQKCPEQFLPYLARTLNYKYNDLDAITVNRNIIDMFIYMIRHKGSELGLKMATALSIISLGQSSNNQELGGYVTNYVKALKNLRVTYKYSDEDISNDDIPVEEGHEGEALIIIDYPNTFTQVRYLLDYVRPVGMTVLLRSVLETKNRSDLVVLASAKTNVTEYKINIRSSVNTAEVNFSSPIDDNVFIEILKHYDDTNTLNMND